MSLNDRAKGPKLFSGQWNIYRRVEDARMWEEFELLCIRREVKPSEMLARLARAHVSSER